MEETRFELAVPPRRERLWGATPGKHCRLGPKPCKWLHLSCRRLGMAGAGPMVRIRFPPAKSQQQTRFRHLRHEGFRAKLKMPAGSSAGLNLPIQPYAAPPTCGRGLRPHPRHTSAHIHVERGRRERDGFLQSFLRLVDPTELRLPAGANRRVGLAPTYLGHWCQAEIFSIADCIFAEVVTASGVINGSFAVAANSGKCAGRPRFCHCGKDRINLSPVRSSGP